MDTKAQDDVLYELEKQNPVRVVIRDTESNVNPETGNKVHTIRELKVVALKLPLKTDRKFFYDVGYLRANSNFTYGGIDTFDSITIVIRKVRCRQLTMSSNRQIIIDNESYDIVEIEDMGAAWQLTIKHVKGQNAYATVDTLSSDRLVIGDAT